MKHWNKKIILGQFLAIVIIMGGYFLYDARQPDCANAQECITIQPTIRYNTVGPGGPVAGGCVNRNIVEPVSGTLAPWVGLTGWELRYTEGGDHEIDNVSVNITNVAFTDTRVSFSLNICLNDQNDDDKFFYNISYVVVRWR